MLNKIVSVAGRIKRKIDKLRIGDDVRLASKAMYEGTWGDQLKAAQGFAAEGANLARVLACMSDFPVSADNPLLDRFGFRALGGLIDRPGEYVYEQPLFELTLHTEIRRHIEPDTVNIVELGSGYSKNLFRLWLGGAPAKANYVGCEFTSNGRKCAEYLAALEPSMRFSTRQFDYYKPSLGGFDPRAKTFVFSSYSVEQIPTLGTAVFDALLEIPGLTKVVNIEPVGWQASRAELTSDTERELMADMERSARESNFNTDFLDVVDGLAARGRLVIEQKKLNFLAHRTDLPGTVVVWTPAAKSRS